MNAHHSLLLIALATAMALNSCAAPVPPAAGESAAPDYEREARLAEDARALLWDGEIIELVPLAEADAPAGPVRSKGLTAISRTGAGHGPGAAGDGRAESAAAVSGAETEDNNALARGSAPAPGAADGQEAIAGAAPGAEAETRPSGGPETDEAGAQQGAPGAAAGAGAESGSPAEPADLDSGRGGGGAGDGGAGDSRPIGEGGRPFLAVHSPSEISADEDVALLLHGRGRHPLRPYPNDAVRMGLLESAIPSLAIQLPVLESGSAYNDYLPILPLARQRISAALDWLDRHYPHSRLHVVAHSCGIHMMMDWIDHHGDSRIDSLVGLAMHNFIPDQTPPSTYPIAGMSTAILDVMSPSSSPSVLRRAGYRRAKARAGRTPYQQAVIPGTSASFEGNDEELIGVIVAFIHQSGQAGPQN